MDVYFITPKGLARYRQYRILDTKRDRRGTEDTYILGILGMREGTVDYERLSDSLVGSSDIFPTEADLRSVLRRLYEAGLIDKTER